MSYQKKIKAISTKGLTKDSINGYKILKACVHYFLSNFLFFDQMIAL